MKPENCGLYERYSCPIFYREYQQDKGSYKSLPDICPDSCPIVKLDLSCQENWAFANTTMGTVKSLQEEIADLKHKLVDEVKWLRFEVNAIGGEIKALKKKFDYRLDMMEE